MVTAAYSYKTSDYNYVHKIDYFGLVGFGLSTGLRPPNPPYTCLSTVVTAPGCKSCYPCLSPAAVLAVPARHP